MTKAKRKVAQAMTDEAKIASVRQRVAAVGLDEKEIVPKLLEKYGVLAYDFVRTAQLEPGRVSNRTGEKFLTTRKLIEHIANDEVSDTVLAKAINKQPTEIKAKALAYKVEKEAVEESKSEEIKTIEQEAAQREEKTAVRVDQSAIKGQEDVQEVPIVVVQEEEKNKDENKNMRFDWSKEELKIDEGYQFDWANSGKQQKAQPEQSSEDRTLALSPLYDENSPEYQMRQKAKEKLAEMKEGNGGGEVSFAELKANGVKQSDMNTVMTQDMLGEVSSSQEMLKMSEVAIKVDRSMSGQGRCAAGTNRITSRRDTLNFDYRQYVQDVPTTYYKKSRTSRAVATQGTATAQIAAMHKSDKFVCFDYESDMKGNEQLKNIQAKGTIIGYPGEKNSAQPAGHTTCLAADGQWRTDAHNSEEWLFGEGAAQRYSAKGKGKVCVIFDANATVSDKMAEEMLYQQYVRESQENEMGLGNFRLASKANDGR